MSEDEHEVESMMRIRKWSEQQVVSQHWNGEQDDDQEVG